MAAQGVGTSTSENEKRKREDKVREFWEKNGRRFYIDQDVFDQCYATIKHWLDIPTLVGYLMKHGLVANPTDSETITSPYYLPEQRLNGLLSLAKSRGEYGYFLLYMCIKESVDENPHGHGDAVSVLEEEAGKARKQPPWSTRASPCSQESSSRSTAEHPSQVVYSRGSHEPVTAPSTGPFRPSANPPPPLGGGGGGGGGGGRGGGGGNDMSPGQQDVRGEQWRGSYGSGGNGAHQNMDSQKMIKLVAKNKAKEDAQLRSQNAATPPASYPPTAMMSGPLTNTVYTGPPIGTVPGPRPHIVRYPQQETTGAAIDDIIERDRARARRQATRTVEAPSLYDKVKDAVSQGAVGALFDKFEGEVDVDIVAESDLRDKDAFMDEVSRFIVGSLNSRDSGKLGVLLAGVTIDEPFTITGLPTCFDGPRVAAVRDRFHHILRSKVRSRTAKPTDDQLTPAELSLVKFEIVSVSPSPGGVSRTMEPKEVVLVSLTPDWRTCKNRLYQCRFVDGSGRPKAPEVFKRSEGGTIPVRMQKVKQLENTLNNAFAKLSVD